MEPDQLAKIAQAKKVIIQKFDSGDWADVGLQTGWYDQISGHPRLLRSLDFGDNDYKEHVISILHSMASHDPAALEKVIAYLVANYPEEMAGSGLADVYASSSAREKRLIFSPEIFQIPDGVPDRGLVSLMMSFDPKHNPVALAVQLACQQTGYRCQRADDVWNNSVVMQDIFELIFRSHIVVADLTDRNSNVFYEIGIAHTLGKHVIPITQNRNDVPFDLRHHRYIEYSADHIGLLGLTAQLGTRLKALAQ